MPANRMDLLRAHPISDGARYFEDGAVSADAQGGGASHHFPRLLSGFRHPFSGKLPPVSMFIIFQAD